MDKWNGETTDPLKYTVLTKFREGINLRYPRCLPSRMIAGSKDVAFLFEKSVPVSPEDLVFEQFWMVGIRH